MPKFFLGITFSLLALLGFSCSSAEKKICYKKLMNKRKFNYINQNPSTNFFLIKDSIQTEFVDNKFYAQSKLIWTSCSTYCLVVQKINYEQGLDIGDTLQIKLLSIKRDTISYVSSARGKTLNSRFVLTR